MKILEEIKILKTIKHIKGSELSPELRSKFNVKKNHSLTITVEIEEDFGESLVESFREIKAHKEGKLKLNNARDLLNEL